MASVSILRQLLRDRGYDMVSDYVQEGRKRRFMYIAVSHARIPVCGVSELKKLQDENLPGLLNEKLAGK